MQANLVEDVPLTIFVNKTRKKAELMDLMNFILILITKMKNTNEDINEKKDKYKKGGKTLLFFYFTILSTSLAICSGVNPKYS